MRHPGLLCGESHLPLAATPHFRSAAPIAGGVEKAEVTFGFEMKVTRIAEKPRITFPFSDDAWKALDALGDKVDADLAAQDVRLTMGGEPTFVSIDDYQAAEWNTAAVGPTKRMLSDQLIRRLRDRFAPGGFLHYGQGKWYPGETLPRWAFALYWRKDGKPLWRNAALIAAEDSKSSPGADEAKRFATGIAERLGIAAGHVMTAYEDPAAWLRIEGELPANVDPLDPKLADPEARLRMVRTFERGLGNPTGYVVPMRKWEAKGGPGWVSEIWKLRRGHLFLLPGDSPIGMRLPLDSLPHIAPEDYPHVIPADPFEDAWRASGSRPTRAGLSSAQQLVARQSPATSRARCACPHRLVGRSTRRAHVHLHAAGRAAGRLCRASRRGRGDRCRTENAGACRGLFAAVRSPHQCAQDHARSRRDRGQYSSGRELARSGRHYANIIRGSAADAARRRQIHGRWPPYRHRRRQSCGDRRRFAGGQPVPAPSRSAQEPDSLLAAPSVLVVSVFRIVHRADQPGAAHGRGAAGSALRNGDRAVARAGAGRGRGAAALAGRPAVPAFAGRRHRQHASRRNLHRQIVFARQPDRAAWVWSNSAPSKCRPTRA